MWLIANAKNGISSYEVHRALGVTQKTAWFMLHRVRLAFQNGTIEKLSGHVEADETFIGGKSRNMHVNKRKQAITGTGGAGSGKAIVLGILERGGAVVTLHVNNTRRASLEPIILNTVEQGSRIYTDALPSYKNLNTWFRHEAVDHAVAYVDGLIHTNGLENFWSLLKRTLRGTYVSVEPFHLSRYLDEQAWRYNLRGLTDAQRFVQVLTSVVGKRITFDELTGKMCHA
jgi:transposase-like protein